MKKNLLLTMFAMCFITLGFSQADCGTALALTPGTPQAGATTTGAGSFSDSNTAPNVNPCSTNYNDLEYWFQYTAVATGETLDITVSDLTSNWYGVFIIDNCPDSMPSCIAQVVNGVSMADLTVTTPALTAGTTYYIVLSDFIEGTTAFTMNSVLNAAPLCTTAVVDSSTIVETCNPDGTGTFVVNHVVSNAGDAGTVFDDGTNTYPVTVGTVATGPYNSGDSITIELTGVDSDCDFTVGTYTFTCPQPAPANDECADAVTVACGGQYTGDTTAAAPESPDPGTCTTSAGTGGAVWYTITGANSNDAGAAIGTVGDEVTLDLSLSTFDTKIRVFEGSCAALVCVAGNDDGGAGTTSLLTFTATVGTEYYILVHGFSANAGPYTLDVSCVAPPLCTAAVVDSSTVVEDCANSQFSVDVIVSNTGDLGTVIDDGTTTYPVVAGTVTVGPYATGTTVTLDVVHTDGACDFSLGDFSFDSCPDIIICGTPVNVTYCYTPNDTTEFAYQSSDGSNLKVTFNAGQVEDSWDELIVLDSDGTTELYNGYGAAGDLTGLEFTASGDSITVKIQSDGTGSCSTDAYTSWDFDVTCLSCTPAVATATVVEDCVAGTYMVNVDVTTVGNATDISDGTTTYAISGTGIVPVGPYTTGSSVTLDIVHDDVVCDYELGVFAGVCPPTNISCATATTIACGDSINGTTAGSTGTSEDIGCAMGVNGVWYTFVGDGGDITVTVDADFDHRIGVASGSCGALVNIACDDQSTGEEEYIIVDSVIAETYYVYIAHYDDGDTTTGTYKIMLDCETLTTDEFDSADAFTYYPNPVSNVLNVKAQNNINNVAVYNMLGQEVLRTAPNAVASEVDMSNLQTGAYFVKVTIGNATKTIRVIKN